MDIKEKFAKTKLKHGNILLTHPTETDPDGDPVLIQVPANQFDTPGSAFRKRGYIRYNATQPAAPPKEAKKAGKKADVQPEKTDNDAELDS